MSNPLQLPDAPASVALIGAPSTGQFYVAQAIAAANPGVLLRDFSLQLQQPTLDEIAKGRELAKASNIVVLSVLHSGASGRENPDPKFFTEIWTVKNGWPPHADGRARGDNNGTEIELLRPNRPAVRMRSNDGHRTFNLVTDEELV
jgi:hypothetical protein